MTDKQIPLQPVDKPVICSPYVEPDYFWFYDKSTGQATKSPGRRQAGYWYKTQKFGTKEETLFDDIDLQRAGHQIAPQAAQGD